MLTTEREIKHDRVYRAVVGSLPERMVIVSQDLRIVATNMAWDRFGRENGNPNLVGASVGDIYGAAMNEDDDETGSFARKATSGVHDVLCGARPTFALGYPCSSLHGETWWEMEMFPVLEASGLFVIIHRDRTEYHRLRVALRRDNRAKPPSRQELPPLAPRQRQVLKLIAKGFSNREIALTMGITMKTVDYHIKTLKLKFITSRRAQLVHAGATLLVESDDSTVLWQGR